MKFLQMFRNKSLWVLSLLLFFVASCVQNEQAPKTSKEPWKPVMDEPSELASIMRSIHAEGLERKNALQKGALGPADPNLVFGLITAEPTEPHMVGPAFEPHANAFIKSYGEVATATSVESQIKAHNNLVKSCVACHMNFCQGPIPRIEQLYIP